MDEIRLIDTGYILGEKYKLYGKTKEGETVYLCNETEELENPSNFWHYYEDKKPLLFDTLEETINIKNYVDKFNKINNKESYKDFECRKVNCYLITRLELDTPDNWKSKQDKKRIKNQFYCIAIPKYCLIASDKEDKFTSYGLNGVWAVDDSKTFNTREEARKHIAELQKYIPILNKKDFKIVKFVQVIYERYALVFTD